MIIILIRVFGHTEVAYRIATQESYPSYGYMIKEGATTLWERWEKLEGSGMNSHNHIMLGTVDTFFFKYIAGISSVEPCWKKIKIKPFIPIDLKYASASLNTPIGYLHNSWEKMNNSLKINIHIPVGSTSEVWLPLKKMNSEIKESGSLIWQDGEIIESVKSIEYLEDKENFAVFKVGSGHYEFTINFWS
jgi:alpha-L-rhamnosidase